MVVCGVVWFGLGWGDLRWGGSRGLKPGMATGWKPVGRTGWKPVLRLFGEKIEVGLPGGAGGLFFGGRFFGQGFEEFFDFDEARWWWSASDGGCSGFQRC